MANEVPPSGNHPIRRRRFRRLRIFAAVICLVAVLTFVVIHTPPVRRFATGQVVALLAREQIEFSTDELGYNLLGASFNLRNVRIRSTTWPDAPVFATIGRARINISLLQLLRGRYVVQSGSVEGLDVHYVVDEQGRDNLPRPPKDPNAPEKPLDYLVSQLAVSNVHVRYENRAQQIDAQLPISSIKVTGNDVTDRHAIQLEGAGGAVQAQDRRAEIDRVSGRVDLGDDDVSIEQLHVETVGSHADVTGTIKQFAAPVGDLALKSTVDAARVAPLAKVADPVSGTVIIDATAKGPLSMPVIGAHVTGSGLQFRELRDAQLDAKAAYDLATKRADVASFDVHGPWGGLTGNGNVATEGNAQSRAQATINGVDVGSIMRALRVPYVAATRVDGALQAEWPGVEFLEATGQADARLTATAARPSRSVMPVSGRIVARANGGRIDADLQRVAAAGAEVGGRVAIANDRRLQGAVKGQSSDLSAVIASVEAFLGRPKGSLVPTTVNGAAEVNAQLAGTLDAPTATAMVNAPALKVGMADGIGVNAQATYTPAAVNIGRADITWKEARAHLDGRVELNAARRIDLMLSADQFQIPSMLQALDKGDLPVAGSVSATGSVGGTLDRPVATLNARGSNLAAYDEQLGSLNADVRLNGREVALSNLSIEKPEPEGSGRITGSGSYHLDRRTYTADLKSDNVRLVGLVLPNGQRVRGEVQVTAHGEGSVDSPSGTIDLTAPDLSLNDSSLGKVAIKAVAADNQATINASAEHFNLTADAMVGLMRPFPATVKVRADNLDIKTVTAVRLDPDAPTETADTKTDASPLPPGLEGQLRATIDASGDLTEPEKGKATVALDTFEGKWNGRPFTITSPSPIEYADERLTVGELKVAAGDAALTVTGDLPLSETERAGEMKIDLRGNLATFAQYEPPGTNIALDGAVALTGSLKGTLKRIDPNLELTVDDGLVLSPTLEPGFSDITVRARVADGEARVEQLTANWGSASIEGAGTIPLEAVPPLPVEIPRKGGAATFKAALKNLNPASIPGAPSGTSGKISVNAELSAKRPDLASLDGRITFEELEVAVKGLALAQQQASAVAIASGAVTIEQLQLTGTAGTIKAGGRVELEGDRALDVGIDGNLNVGAISVFTNKVRAEGDSQLNVRARGTLSEPEITGSVDVKNTQFASDEPKIAGENLNAHVDLQGKRIVLANLESDLNGGTLKASGDLTLGDGSVSDIDLKAEIKDFAFDAPLDLRSISHSSLRITRRGEDFVIDGQVTIDEAGLTGDINFDQGILAAMTARRRLDLTEQRNPLLERVRFNINVDTETPILVDNNLARAEIESDLRLVGTPYETGLLGELRLLEGSEIRLNERRYQAEPSVITFVDERRIFPSFDLHLNTTASNYAITIVVTGTPGETETTLTSDPSLPEPDIMAMLVTGRTLDQMRGEEYDVAREQALSYLTGRVGSSLGRGLQQATGFSEVRIEPSLIANEADPGARLTVGQDVTSDLKLVYSTNLVDSNDQIWVAEYDLTRRFQTRGVRQSDNSYRFDFRHDVRLGGEPAPRRMPHERPKVEGVMVEADGADETTIREKFGVKAGDSYDFFKIRNGAQHVEEALMVEGYLQSRVRLERHVEGDKARLVVHVMRGPKVDIQFVGAKPPSKVEEQVRTQWNRGVFDKQRGDDGVDAIREWLIGDNYFQPKVEYTLDNVGEQRRVTFNIDPGMRSEKIILAFEGASAIHPSVLDKIVEQQKLERKLFTDPLVVTELLQRYYREEGYLVTEIDAPRYEYSGGIARVVLPVREGPQFKVRKVTTSGTNVFKANDVVAQLPVVAGELFLPLAAENSLEKIRQLYWGRGYNDVRSDYSLVVDRGTGQVDVAFNVNEGRQSVIADVRIAGLRHVSEHLVSEQVQLKPGQPLDLSVLAKSRRNLYDSGAFSVVDISRRERRGLAPESVSIGPNQRPIQVNVTVREAQPFQIRYGASYDTERGVGGIFDIANKNSLGGAREIGLRSRYDKQLHDGRIYLNQPALKYLPKTTVTLYFREELNPPTEITDPFDTNRKGISVQSEQRLRNLYVFSYGYRLERAHTLTPTVIGVIDDAHTVSPVTGTLTRETRDEVLDSSKGSFVSHAFSYSPSYLGADTPYIKYFGQYFHYFPLEAPKRKPFTNEILRPRLVFATGVRLGLSRGLANDVVPKSERFFAGGSASMRGFGQNAVGPIGLDRVPLGGEAMLVLNNELRVPLISLVDGVAFADIGNVFGRVRDFSLTDLRKSTGVGLRVRTPWVLLRADYGIVLDQRPGEPRSRIYVSIGQAF